MRSDLAGLSRFLFALTMALKVKPTFTDSILLVIIQREKRKRRSSKKAVRKNKPRTWSYEDVFSEKVELSF